ncbi:MAG: TadE/TadG family type IV pilus assembly protein [Pseudomonadota bacterium]
MSLRQQRIRREDGAVALVFGLSLTTLLIALGLVIDLAHLYIVKTELQNAVDSAALAGATAVNSDTSGVNAAVTKATTFGGKNNYNFSNAVSIAASNIHFGSSPTGPWLSQADALLSPTSTSYVKVESGTISISTYLMGIAGISTVTASASAVAGRGLTDVAPLGVCAIDPSNKTNRRGPFQITAGLDEYELLEYGFRRGITYNMGNMGPIAGNADPILINAVDSTSGSCTPSHSSTAFTVPFICTGTSAAGATGATSAYANTGGSYGAVERALNSRFDVYTGGGQGVGTNCGTTSGSPDRNIKEYKTNTNPGGPKAWMSANPTQQAISWSGTKPEGFDFVATTNLPTDYKKNGQPLTAQHFGVLWSYSRGVRAVGSSAPYTAGTAFSTADWNKIYVAQDGTSPTTSAGYPSGGLTASPYSQTSGNYYSAPSHTPGTSRRQMKLVIVNCNTLTTNAMSCKSLPILGVGSFFLQTQANLNGSNRDVYLEFGGLVASSIASDIRLY